MSITNFPESLQVALGRKHYPAGAGYGLDNYRSDCCRVVQLAQSFQVVGEFSSMFGQPATKGVAFNIQRMPKVIDIRQEIAKCLAISGNATH
jgi:hypothetical protein